MSWFGVEYRAQQRGRRFTRFAYGATSRDPVQRLRGQRPGSDFQAAPARDVRP